MAAFPQRRGSRDRGKERLQWGVRRDKGAFQWVQAPPGDSLQPEAIGAVMEVTKWLKPSISVSRIGDSECAGRNASERRASLENVARTCLRGGLPTGIVWISAQADGP